MLSAESAIYWENYPLIFHLQDLLSVKLLN